MGAHVIAALIAGLLFGCGLTVSQMINPKKVLDFLDFGGIPTGTWDPSLALVMAGALAVTLIGYAIALRREAPVLEPRFALPTKRELDTPLIAGAGLFGIGWGLGGFCPGPAISALHLGIAKPLIFVSSMLAGMALYEALIARRTSSDSS
ncbi:MAG: YeeE/YedE family protein [Rhodospirillales bacterium]|nr:YeeE/YedE family protein [Rhodospirillales bacterium]